jgi:hypothetical protein
VQGGSFQLPQEFQGIKAKQKQGWIGIDLLHISRQRGKRVCAVSEYYANENRAEKERRHVL